MQLKESKTDSLVFTRARDRYSTSFTVNDKYIERKEVSKLLGVWLQEDGSYETNTQQLCKQGYARISMLTKLKYAGVSREDLLHLYKQFIRSKLEYCSVLFHSSLTVQQSASLERCQAVCLRVMLGEDPILPETSKRTHDETGGRRRRRRRKEEAVGEGETGRR